jgi:hypothetical protein
MPPSTHPRRARLAVALLAWASVTTAGQVPLARGLAGSDEPTVATLRVARPGATMTGELRFDAGDGTSGGLVELGVATNPTDPPKRATGEPAAGRYHVVVRLAGTYRGGPYGVAEGDAVIAGTFADLAGCESRLDGRGTFRVTVSGPLGLAELSADWPHVEFQGCAMQSPQPFSIALPPFAVRSEAVAFQGAVPPQEPRPAPDAPAAPTVPPLDRPVTTAPPAPTPWPPPALPVTQYPAAVPGPTGTGPVPPANSQTGPLMLAWIGTSPDRIGVRGPGMDGQPDAEFEIRYARGDKLVQMVNLSMVAPNGQLCCQAWSTAGTQFHFLGVSTPGTGVLANSTGFTPTLGYPPETLRLHAASPGWFTAGWNVLATVVFSDGTFISGSTIIGGGLPFPGPGAGLPAAGGQGPGPDAPSIVGTWSIACCNDSLTGTLTITQLHAGAFSGAISGNLVGDIVNGQVRGDLIEFDRRTDEGPQRWSGRLSGSGADLRVVGGTWTGAYANRFTQDQHNWHAEKQR